MPAMNARWVFAAVVVVLVALRLLGAFTVGVVTSGSMGPTLPVGSVFLGVRGEVDAGDIVVFRAPDGARVVHRAVAPVGDGWTTKGDANEATDQANGLPPARPYAIVPEVAGAPLALRAAWLTPLGLVVAQTALLAYGLKGFLDERRRGGRPLAVRPHHLALAAAALTLAAAPFVLHAQAQAHGAVTVTGTVFPTVVRVESADGVSFAEVPPLGTATVAADGPVDVVRAPALPGARALAAYGAAFAALPVALAFAALGGTLRWAGC